jgi:hypothetical protein
MRRGLRLLAGAALPLVVLLGGRVSAHAGAHRAALVIEDSNGSLIERCVSFAEEAITGLALIQRSGVEYQARSFGDLGSAVCQLDFEPAQVPSSCFGSGPTWAYYRETAGGWRLSASGAGGSAVHDGDVDGWHYAAGPHPPPPVAFAQVCGALPSPAAAARISSPPATANAARPATALPLTAKPPSLEATDPIRSHAPMGTLTLTPDTSRSRIAAALPPVDAAAALTFAASATLLSLALLWAWRRRAP